MVFEYALNLYCYFNFSDDTSHPSFTISSFGAREGNIPPSPQASSVPQTYGFYLHKCIFPGLLQLVSESIMVPISLPSLITMQAAKTGTDTF